MDSRVHIVPLNGHLWSTYVTIESLGLLDDVKTTTWDGGGQHTNLVLLRWLRTRAPQFIRNYNLSLTYPKLSTASSSSLSCYAAFP